MKTVIYEQLPQEALAVRHTVFVEEQGFVDDPDEVDSYAVHLVAFDEECPIAVCRVFESDEQGIFLLGRFAVLADWRGNGIGRDLLRSAENCVRDRGGKVLMLHSQEHAKGFYEACGYTAFGEAEYEQDQPHVWMKRVL